MASKKITDSFAGSPKRARLDSLPSSSDNGPASSSSSGNEPASLSSEDSVFAASDTASTYDGGIAQAFQTTVSLQKKAVSGSMRILYWLAKEEIAHFTKFDSLRLLCVGGNAKYNSHRLIDEWLAILSETIEEDMLNKIKLSPAIGFMRDESTDISVTKEPILYAHITASGKVSTHFLKLIHIADGKAETIERALMSFLDHTNIPISNITAFGSDGANVMVGHVSGVAARLKHRNPQILSIHCINHHLVLGTSQAAAEVPYLVKFLQILSLQCHKTKRFS